MSKTLKEYPLSEEIANIITHGLGFLLSITALVLLTIRGVRVGETMELISLIVFGLTLSFLYANSTLYHSSFKFGHRLFFKKMDHISIFYLIAGTYTPISLLVLPGAWAWSIFGTVWGLALAGTILKAKYVHRFERLGLAIYLAMGWLVVVAMKPLIQEFSGPGLHLIFAGGLFYSGGVIFYKWHKLPFNHAIWHLFVLMGSFLHFCSIYIYVA